MFELAKIQKLRQRLPLRSRPMVLIVGGVAVVGVVVLVTALAAGAYFAVETENGTLSGGAAVVSDSSASGGKAIQFGAGSTPTPAPTPAPTPLPTPTPTPSPGVGFNTCTNPQYTLPANPSNPQDGITLSGYYVDTDTWNFAGYPGSQQTMYICDYNNWYAMVNVNNNNGDGAVKTYPNVHMDYNSPKISSFTGISSIFAHTAPTYGDWDYAYDIWLNGVASNGSTELMIWTQSAGKQAHVPGIPIVGTVTLSGITYDIHKSGSYIAYDMQSTRTSGTVNLLEIFNNVISHGWIPSTSTIGAIDYGVEVCNTNSINTKFQVNNFGVTTQ